MYRTGAYDRLLSRQLRSKRFAQTFLLDLTEGADGLTVEEALRHTIHRMGITEFGRAAGIPLSNVEEFLQEKRRLKPRTLDRNLKPFGLKTVLILQRAS